ncbi:unnamed protein product [Symbiodinium pilosum]|uniref:Methyltransferase FkbM domain-containing protein n=1 Tax=Symbiodinium pilosum TaxID=2952 RepID=A0A812X806_SYMPI|nr:unnamed protein product [Symbiodinium pilosum]
MTKCLFSLLLALIVIPLVTAAVVALIAVSFVAIILLLVAAASVLLCAFVPLCSLVILMALPFLIDKLKSVGSFHLDRAVLLLHHIEKQQDQEPQHEGTAQDAGVSLTWLFDVVSHMLDFKSDMSVVLSSWNVLPLLWSLCFAPTVLLSACSLYLIAWQKPVFVEKGSSWSLLQLLEDIPQALLAFVGIFLYARAGAPQEPFILTTVADSIVDCMEQVILFLIGHRKTHLLLPTEDAVNWAKAKAMEHNVSSDGLTAKQRHPRVSLQAFAAADDVPAIEAEKHQEPKHLRMNLLHGFKLFGDSAWCLAAFEDVPNGLQGLSFGIEERDLWSETMSNVFHMPTKLYDCFQDPKKSPPLSMSAPNAAGSCEGVQSHCYETAYEAFRICLGPDDVMLEGRRYTTLNDLLRGRAPLSVHVKMDVEGSEWTVLEALLANATDLAKIRTLDMEVHFGFGAASEAPKHRGSMEEVVRREVGIFEKLAATFLTVGSNVETNAQGWNPAAACTKLCDEPLVHTRGGFPVNQFAVSFVNPAMLRSNNPKHMEVGARGIEQSG